MGPHSYHIDVDEKGRFKKVGDTSSYGFLFFFDFESTMTAAIAQVVTIGCNSAKFLFLGANVSQAARG